MTDTTFLHYAIERRLGKGGMGEVFLARDTRLQRPVALKFLSGDVSADLSAMERFEREAQATAALNHPAIVTIYDIGEHAGRHYIAMEYVDGMPLRELIAAGPLEISRAASIARQLSEGLERAHERGIIHRDIKPENILVTDDGSPKLVDFGIAKLRGLRNLTAESATVGTVRYMAPEQIKGEEVDRRADVWALGVVLYEMLTGQSPFKGDYDSSLMYSILSDQPEPLVTYRKDIPAGIQEAVTGALQKDPKDRLGDMAALRRSLVDALAPEVATAPVTARARPRSSRVWWIGGAIGLVALLLLLLPSRDQAPPAVVTMTQATYLGDIAAFDLAPDGATVAYVASGPGASRALHVLDIAGGSSVEVLIAPRIGQPCWSPDGRVLAVSAVLDDSTRGTFLVPRLGGSTRRVSPAASLQLAWDETGERIALYDAGRLLIVGVPSGETRTLDLPDSVPPLRSLSWSPDGDVLAASSIDDRFSALWGVRVGDGRAVPLARVPLSAGMILSSPRWTADGDAVYCLRRSIQTGEAELTAFPREPAPGRDPRVVALGLQDVTELDIAADGRTLVALREIVDANLWLAQGKGTAMTARRLTRGTAWRSRASLSADGRRAVFSMKDIEGFNLYVLPVSGTDGDPGQAAKITSLRSYAFAPVWSPDGNEIAFGSSAGGALQIWRVAPDGGNLRPIEGTRLHPGADPLEWSPGSEIIYATPGGRTLRRLDPSSGRSEPLVRTDSVSAMDAPAWAPGGERFAVRVYRGYEDSLAGVWVATPDRLETRLTTGWEYVPLGWTSDGRNVLLIRAGRPEVHTVDARGGPLRDAFTLPFEAPEWTGLSLRRDGSSVLYTRFRDQRDLWVVKRLDGSERWW